MINRRICLILLGLALALTLAGSVLATAQDASHQEPETAKIQGQAEEAAREYNLNTRRNFKLPKMFDFERYKQAFKKVYRSSLEEMVRLKLFLARMYRVFISAVGFKHRGSSYYLAVNERSDWTKAELEGSENKFLSNDKGRVPHNGDEHEKDDEYLGPEELEAELAEIERHTDEPRYAQLAEELHKARDQGKSRRRRSAETRDFDITQALERSTSGRLGPRPKLEKVASNNPEYEQPELMSRGTYADYLMHPDFKLPAQRWINDGNWRDYKQLPVKSKYKTVTYLDSFFSMLGIGPEGGDNNEKVSPDNTDDVVWVDQRRSNCLPEVQNQRLCGSCYAFAVTTYFEFAYCKETGKLAKFSEQYLIDCGDKLELYGCDGGRIEVAGEFIANFGVELNQHYPYQERQEMCPYEPETEMTHMGYIRLDVNSIARIPVQIWEDYLKDTVIVFTINTAGDFHEYGGGVWDGLKCEEEGRHAMVVIGHGREDGEEYWLIRNSHGPEWGEEGHIRVNKNSDCIHPRDGYIWGARNGANVHLWPERNKHITEPVAKDALYQFKSLFANSLPTDEGQTDAS